MTRRRATASEIDQTRRNVLKGAAAATSLCLTASPLFGSQNSAPTDLATLKQAALHAGKILGVYTVQHELFHEEPAASAIPRAFSLIADGNDLKFSNRLRPSPDSFNFDASDAVIGWAEKNGLMFRGHCLAWWNALPQWFGSYVTQENARRVLVDHIKAVVGRYAGRVYSWDVVNEPVYHDGRRDGLRRKPWLDLIGPDYIDIAFHAAATADSHARLLLNECYIEHATPSEQLRRNQYLNLAKDLKSRSVPISGIGIQGHLRGATPLDREGVTSFAKEVQGLGLEIFITELDVDSIGVAPADVELITASKISEFIDILGPYVNVITLEALADPRPSAPLQHGWENANILTFDLRPKRAYSALVETLDEISKGKHSRLPEHEDDNK